MNIASLCRSRIDLLASTLSIWAGLSSPARALSVRVDASRGAPRIVVDGAPVRARMFWGAPGSKPIRVTPQTRGVSFDFVASGSTTTGTMHFRFGQQAGEVALDDIQVTDLDAARDLLAGRDFEGADSFAREWNVWPPEQKENVAVATGAGREGSSGLRVQVRAPEDGNWPDFHIYHSANLSLVEGHRYRARFWVRSEQARDLTVAFYQPGASYTRLGGASQVFESQIGLAADAGVNFVSFPVPLLWFEPGQAQDWSSAEAACRAVLRANPRALLIPRIGMEPPEWWCKANPDDVMRWEDGGHGNFAVPASPRYRRDASARLAALIRHLEASFGERIAGYHPTGQNTGEWFYEGTWKRPLNGYAPADLAAWRQWLRARYKSDEALQRAWARPNAALDAAQVPTPAERHASPNGIFRDPQHERHLIDWAEFQQQAMADCVIELACATRTASRGQKLVLFFYGYNFEFAPVANGPATSGHYALRRVLNSRDIDVLCSPISYFDRGLGQSAPAMTAAESVAMAGKMWLCEDDTHTYLASEDFPGHNEHVSTIQDTNSQLMRNVAQESMRNMGTWWMDLGSSGWFNDAAMWRVMTRMRALDEPMLRNPTPFRPQVAAIIDERAMLRVAEGGSSVTAPGIYEARRALGRMGAPYGQYLLDDVGKPQLRAKLYVMLNAWALSANGTVESGTPSTCDSLLRGMRGATRIWCFAPGYFQDDRVASPQAVRRLTGWMLGPVAPQNAWATPTQSGRKLGLTQAFGVQSRVKPLLAAIDATPSETLATYPDGGAAIALRRTKEGPSLFVGVPGLSSELLRLAARQAGVHLFTQSDCNIYANGPFLALHGAQDGPVEVNTGEATSVFDVLSGARLAPGPKFSLRLKRGETRVLRY